MARPTLVTGGTGALGRAVVHRLQARGHAVRLFSRSDPPAEERTSKPATEWVVGDLATSPSIHLAVQGVDTIVHCATSPGGGDVAITRRLADAASRAENPPHLIYISIVGIETVPLSYYRTKLACEGVVAGSGLPWTIQRATQFHDLVARMTDVQHRWPLVVAPAGIDCQPIDVRDVARRLVEWVEKGPAGRTPEIGGPEVRSLVELARSTLDSEGRDTRVVGMPMPGAIASALRRGEHLTPDHAEGEIGFDQFLAERAVHHEHSYSTG
ncbi:SDR family oxidoreductase [Actinoalloteichus hymeniacidonis]|uniref:NAD(P)-binding domain-containing protein n=1 Tax=Actinoalloteichus hymeniacidonis TaxID=340345 RepID=A0AAC9HRP8_9PSEU|nr:SDR family oxidoreductase [Actinoalloteichus hymeniacidonis]AOS64165.1 hypothetical protein TL08_16825 [Actinoalloteichus hymeniacidonis]MBB5907768.1 uncharacterized protein YbjT (DUF2867 family) [Actinoalloteichus hymeniacidonis]